MKTFGSLLDRYLPPPAFEEEKNYTARTTLVILVTLLIGSIVITLVTWLLGRFTAFRLISLETGVILVAIWLVRRGYFTQASSLVLLTFWGLLTYLAYRGDGIHDTVMVAYPAFVVAASLILNRRLLALFVLLLIFSVGLIIYSEINDFIATGYNKSFVLSDGLIIIIIIVVTAIATSLLMNNLINSLTLAHRNERALAQSNQDLQESQRFIQRVTETIPGAVYIFDLVEKRNVFMNRNLLSTMIGYTPEEAQVLRENALADLIHPDDYIRLLQHFRRFETTPDEIVLEFEYRMRGTNNEWHWFHSWDTVFARTPEGKPAQLLGLTQEVTERKQIETALQENETLLRAIINHIPFDLWVCDTEGRYILQNDISFNLVGNLIGKSVNDLNISPEIYAVYKEKHLRALRGETIREEIEELVKGEKRSFDSIQAPFRDGERILGFIGMNIDITERKQAELALQAYSERLEERVEERTRALQEAQEKLIRQEKLAVLGQLAGSVGHELRNPLGVITNAVYFLQMVLPQTDERIKEYLELIGGRVREVDKIVADLLSLSRTRPALQESVAVMALLEEALRRSPPPEKVIIITAVPHDLPPILVDPQQIESVLVNLIVNAYQAMPAGGELILSAQVKKKWLKLSISDTGVGMSPETMSKIFEPLFTTKAKGIGLGLAVSKSLVEINRGNIEVESTEGEGSTFNLILPTREAG